MQPQRVVADNLFVVAKPLSPQADVHPADVRLMAVQAVAVRPTDVQAADVRLVAVQAADARLTAVQAAVFLMVAVV